MVERKRKAKKEEAEIKELKKEADARLEELRQTIKKLEKTDSKKALFFGNRRFALL